MLNRLDAIEQIRARLRNGGHSIGTWLQIPAPSVAEILGAAGYDWVAVDLEHGAIAIHQLPDLFRAIELGDTLPLARLAQGHPTDCKQALDAGAGGVIVPMIDSAAQLESIRAACCWPPAGSRGVGFARANLFGKRFDTYTREAQTPLLIAMIEHIRAVEQLPEITAVSGLDALLIGPYDLSASLGLTAQFQHPDVIASIERIHRIAADAGLPCGLHVVQPAPEELRQRLREGYRFLPYSIDAVFLNHSAVCPQIAEVAP